MPNNDLMFTGICGRMDCEGRRGVQHSLALFLSLTLALLAALETVFNLSQTLRMASVNSVWLTLP